MAFKVGGASGLAGDLSVTRKPVCPCCGSEAYLQTVNYDANGIAIGKSSTCMTCRDQWCNKCTNG